MWRAFFLATGIYVIMAGAQCLGVQQFVLKSRAPLPPPPETTPDTSWRGWPRKGNGQNPPPKPVQLGPNRVLTPQPSIPWILMASGTVVCLYSFTIPRRLNGN